MTGYFTKASTKFNNSINLVISHQKIKDFQPINDLRRHVYNVFSLLHDSDDKSSQKIKLQTWKLLTTVEISIIPYDREELRLNDQLKNLQEEAEFFPALQEGIAKIVTAVSWLQDNPENPKRKALITKLQEVDGNGRVGIVSKLTRGRALPGWGNNTLKEFERINHNCSFLDSISDIRTNLYDCIIIPSAGGSCPFIDFLMSSFSSKELFFLYFGREKRWRFNVRSLPPGTFGIQGSKDIANVSISPAIDETWSVDDWVDETYWERMREEFYRVGGSSSQNESADFLVPARLVAFGNAKTAVLREDHKLIEISSIVDGNSDIDELGKKFPRKPTKELKNGDLIVMRTSGSGDTLDDISMSLMEQDGKSQLMSEALDWKPLLKQTFLAYKNGTHLVANKLATKGHVIKNPDYMWNWTTEHVIRPESMGLFVDLIKVINELDTPIPAGDPVKYAEEKWSQMSILVRYRMKAGRKIRELLLGKLRQVIEKGEVIGNEYHLKLSEIGGGELSVFRVSGVDSKIINVPYNRTGIICEIKDH